MAGSSHPSLLGLNFPRSASFQDFKPSQMAGGYNDAASRKVVDLPQAGTNMLALHDPAMKVLQPTDATLKAADVL